MTKKFNKTKFNKTPCHPLGHRVLLKLLNDDTYTEAGIFIPKKEETLTIKCQVVEIGSTAFEGYGDPWYKEGDIVIIVRGAGSIVEPALHKQPGEVYKTINEVDAYLLIED